MPIYEYVCQSCGRRTEVIQRMGEKPLKICPHCGGKLKKAISAPAIQFKGTGWYVTDYARGGKKEGGKKSSGSDSSETESKKEKPAETKTESKKDTKKTP